MYKDGEQILKEVKSLQGYISTLPDNIKNDFRELTKICKVNRPWLFSMYPSIFQLCVSGNMDIPRLKYMLKIKDNVKKGKISSYNADIKVGQKLVDEIVKPTLNNEK